MDDKEKDFLRELIKQVIEDMRSEEETLTSEINATGDIAGFDAPLGAKKVKRKLRPDDEEE